MWLKVYFKTSSILHTVYDLEPNKKRRTELMVAIQRFDTWVAELDGRRKLYMNPLSFANETHSSWANAIKIFKDAHNRKMLSAVYQYHDPMTYEVLYSSTNLNDMTQNKFINEFGIKTDISKDYIEVIYSLQEHPLEVASSEISESASKTPIIAPAFMRQSIKQAGNLEALHELDNSSDYL